MNLLLHSWLVRNTSEDDLRGLKLLQGLELSGSARAPSKHLDDDTANNVSGVQLDFCVIQ